MTDQKFTRCPGCATVFRVTPAQLALREGQVRCGHCRAVFDANDHVVSLDAGPAPDEFDAQDELALGRPTVTLRSADALQAVPPRPAVASGNFDAGSNVAAPTPTAAPLGEAGFHERTADESVEGIPAEGQAEAAAAVEGAAGEGAADEGAAVEGAASEGAASEGAAKGRPADQRIAADEPPPAAEFPTAHEPNVSAESPGVAARESTTDAAAAAAVAGAPTKPGPDASDLSASGGEAGAAAARDADAREPAAGESSPESPMPGVALAPIDIAATDRAGRFEWKKRRTAGGVPPAVQAGALGLLVFALVLQAVFGYRDTLAAHVPASRPLLVAACNLLSCAISPLRDAAALSIDASDLQADPAHRGLLLLTATMRNRAAHAIAYPYLELTLTDSADRIVVRRAFTPSEYAGATAEPRRGIPPNGEHVVRLFLDASASQQAGYRLYLFYP